MTISENDLGWQNLRAGISLISWSKLAIWDKDNLKLIANEDKQLATYEGFKDVHNEYGRVICWVTFSVGAEYLVKGYYILEKQMKGMQVYDKKGEEVTERYIINAPLLKLLLIIDNFIEQGTESQTIKKSLHHLRKFIRNRDIHSYEKDVRGNNLYLVKNKFLPAFNLMLASLDQSGLEYHLKNVQ